MSLSAINERCEKALEQLKTKEQEIPKGKELPPLIDESSERPARASRDPQDYHTAFLESCQEATSLIDDIGDWLESFISDIYNNQSEDWQHGYDVGEKITELKHLMKVRNGI